MTNNEIQNRENRRLVFNHEWTSFLFRSDRTDLAFLDRCRYTMLTPWEMMDGDCMVEAEDLKRMFAPDLHITLEDRSIRVEFESYLRHIPEYRHTRAREIVDGCAYWKTAETDVLKLELGSNRMDTVEGAVEIAAAPFQRDGKLFLPVAALMGQGCKAYVDRLTLGANTFWKKKVEPREYLCISFDRRDFHFSREWIETVMDTLLKKDWGNVFETIWFEEGRRLMPYRMYIPSTYRADRPNKAIIMFHGGGTNENVYYDDSHDRLQFYAEKYGYILIAPTSYGLSTFFGSLIPILQTLDGIDPETADPANPEGWPQATLDLRAMANRCAWVELDYIFSRWNIDRRNLFGQGNSAGSNALTYFAITYPGLFKAIIPGAGWVNPNFADLTKLRGIPIMHLIGSEDHHGVDYVKVIYQIVDELGLDCRKYIVGGGTHFNAWISIIDEMFAFYESNLT